MKSNKCNGAIFDFNGTLFFDADKHQLAWNRFATDIRGFPFSTEEMKEYVHGRTNRAILEYLLKKEIPDEVLRFFVEKKEAFYRHVCLSDPTNMRLAPGAIALFEKLIEHKISMTIATSSEIKNLEFFEKEFGLNRWFDMKKVVYDDHKIKGKPAPDMYLAACRNINVQPSECVVFEDSSSGVLAANRAGIAKTVIIQPTSEVTNYGEADLVIPDFTSFDFTGFF